MLHVIHGTDPLSGGRVLAAMFAARKNVFVDLLGWTVPVVGGRYEIDQFDDHHATYLVVTDDSGAHRASARLLPTTRPHILGDLYPALCDGAVPRGPGILEITRFCLDRRLNARDRRIARDLLVTAIARHGLTFGIHLYTGVAEISWLQQILAFGWRCRPIGVPQRCGGAMLGTMAIDIDADTPALLAAAGIQAVEDVELPDAA